MDGVFSFYTRAGPIPLGNAWRKKFFHDALKVCCFAPGALPERPRRSPPAAVPKPLGPGMPERRSRTRWGPLPLIAAPSAPAWIMVCLIASISRCWWGGRTPSKTLNVRRAIPSRSPCAKAARVPLVSGRRWRLFLSHSRNRAGVEMENRGLHRTNKQAGRAGSGVNVSPVPGPGRCRPARNTGRRSPPPRQSGPGPGGKGPRW